MYHSLTFMALNFINNKKCQCATESMYIFQCQGKVAGKCRNAEMQEYKNNKQKQKNGKLKNREITLLKMRQLRNQKTGGNYS